MMRAPVAPSGWPSAIAPPSMLTLSSDEAEFAHAGDGLRGERLVEFDDVDLARPRCRRAPAPCGVAPTGPMPMISGAQPATAMDLIARQQVAGRARLA